MRFIHSCFELFVLGQQHLFSFSPRKGRVHVLFLCRCKWLVHTDLDRFWLWPGIQGRLSLVFWRYKTLLQGLHRGSCVVQGRHRDPQDTLSSRSTGLVFLYRDPLRWHLSRKCRCWWSHIDLNIRRGLRIIPWLLRKNLHWPRASSLNVNRSPTTMVLVGVPLYRTRRTTFEVKIFCAGKCSIWVGYLLLFYNNNQN